MYSIKIQGELVVINGFMSNNRTNKETNKHENKQTNKQNRDYFFVYKYAFNFE